MPTTRVLLIEVERPDVARALRARGVEVEERSLAGLGPDAVADLLAVGPHVDADAVLRAIGSGPVPLRATGADLLQAITDELDRNPWPEVVQLGPTTVDLAARTVLREGATPKRLTPTEARVLGYLVRHAGRTVSREELLVRVWGYGASVVTRTVDTTVRRLRGKVERDGRNPEHLATAYGSGYVFHAPRAEPPAPPEPLPGAPEPLTPLVGRAAELVLLDTAMAEARLVTLTGTGGAGKTRLAAHFATTRAGRFAGGVSWCDLTEARDRAGVLAAVGHALEVPLTDARDGVEQIGRALATRGRCLVVLDNFEQVVSAAPSCVPAWLRASPGARVLVTSRAPLHLEGERCLAVEPLPEDDAVALFLDHARRLAPDYARADDDRDVVAAIAARLGMLPLALELGAGRARVLGPKQLLARLDDRLSVLPRGRRDAPARHATLAAAVAWSWDLLDREEREALACASVFRGGFSPEAAAAVVGPAADRLTSALRDKSLLTGRGRLGMLPHVRTFCEDRLGELGMADAARDRHLAWAIAFSVAAVARLGHLDAVEPLRTERENLLAAWRWASAHRSSAPEVALALNALLARQGPAQLRIEILEEARDIGGGTLGQQVEVEVALGEALRAVADADGGDRVLDHALELALRGSPQDEARVRAARALAALRRNDLDGAEGEVLRAIERARLAPNPWIEATAHHYHAAVRTQRGALRDAVEPLESALALLAPPDAPTPPGTVVDEELRASVGAALGFVRTGLGQSEQADAAYSAALQIADEVGNRRQVAAVWLMRGNLALTERRFADSDEAFHRALHTAERLGELHTTALCLANLGWLSIEAGELPQARARLLRALSMQRDLGNRRNEAVVRGNLGVVALLERDWTRARADLEACVQLAAGAQREGAYYRCYLGVVLAGMGEADAAEATLDEAEALLEGSGDGAGGVLVEVGRGHVALARGDRGDAEARAALDTAHLGTGVTDVLLSQRLLREALAR